jgi:hypothetical protein
LANFAISGLCSSGQAVNGGSRLSIRCSSISRNLTISARVLVNACFLELDRTNRPCIVSECLSKDTGFCLNTTFPFFSSMRDRFSGFSEWLTRQYSACWGAGRVVLTINDDLGFLYTMISTLYLNTWKTIDTFVELNIGHYFERSAHRLDRVVKRGRQREKGRLKSRVGGYPELRVSVNHGLILFQCSACKTCTKTHSRPSSAALGREIVCSYLLFGVQQR